jgi:hypothetical protein
MVDVMEPRNPVFTEKQNIELRELLSDLISCPLPIEQQEHIIKEKDVWCTDWRIIEVLKRLFLGDDAYKKDPPPNRLIKNKLFDMDGIFYRAGKSEQLFKDLNRIKDKADNLLVCECERGTNILISSFVKSWNKILCYDENKEYINSLERYIRLKCNINVVSQVNATITYDFRSIGEKTILVAIGVESLSKKMDEIKNNPNIVDSIILPYE